MNFTVKPNLSHIKLQLLTGNPELGFTPLIQRPKINFVLYDNFQLFH